MTTAGVASSVDAMQGLEGYWVLRAHKVHSDGQPGEAVDLPFFVRKGEPYLEVNALGKDGQTIIEGSCAKNLRTIRLSAQFYSACFETDRNRQWDRLLCKVYPGDSGYVTRLNGVSKLIREPAQKAFKRQKERDSNNDGLQVQTAISHPDENPQAVTASDATESEPSMSKETTAEIPVQVQPKIKLKKLKKLREEHGLVKSELTNLLHENETAKILRVQHEKYQQRLQKTKAKRDRLKTQKIDLKNKLQSSRQEEADIKAKLGL